MSKTTNDFQSLSPIYKNAYADEKEKRKPKHFDRLKKYLKKKK